jgi:trigger factor
LKILGQDIKGYQVILEVEEDYEKLEPQIEEAYSEAAKDVKIPGFRPGKVPSSVLKQYLNEEAVIDRAIQLLVAEIYPEMLDSAKIKPVDYPKVDVKQMKKGSPIIFIIKVDVHPDVKISNYKGIKVKKKETFVKDLEVDETLEAVRKDYAKHSNIPESELPLDDEFAKKVSRSNTLQELKALIRSNIEEEKKRESEQSIRDDVTRNLAEIVEAEVPKGMVEREIELMLSDLEVSLKRSRMTLSSYLSAIKKDIDKVKEEMKASSLTRVKAKLALEAIAEKEKLDVDEGELDKEIEALAQHSGKAFEEYKSGLSADVLGSIKDYMLKEKAIDFVVSKAKVEG